jgi:hypothetical protein
MIRAPADEVKNLTLSYIGSLSRFIWLRSIGLIRLCGVRRLGFLIPLLFATSAVAGPPASNPAFLGIKMVDTGSGCLVDGVTRGSAAQEAGIRQGDLIIAIDRIATLRCDDLKNRIVGHPAGDRIKLDLRRGNTGVTSIEVTLSTRADVLHHRFVGHTMEPLELPDADNAKQSYDLGDLQGRTTVIGWFLLSTCTGCSQLFDRVSDAMAARKFQTAPQLLAVTRRASEPTTIVLNGRSTWVTNPNGLPSPLLPYRKTFTSSTPLAIAEPETFEDFAIDDPERVHFMVIDCRGVVRFVTPIAPQSDDIDAAIDEVLAAAEQAEHSRTQRR